MRRLLVLITVALLGIAPVGQFAASARQGAADEAWDNVTRPEPTSKEALLAYLGGEGEGSLSEKLAAYAVTFEQPFAHVPEVDDVEFMLVFVESGEFVLDVMGPTSVVVDPADSRTVTIMDIEETEAGGIVEAKYAPSANVLLDQNDPAMPCKNLCTVPTPDQFGRTAVQLLPGDWVISPAGGPCVWCLLNQYAEATQGQPTGTLLVFPFDDGGDDNFSWIQAFDADASAYGGPIQALDADGPATNDTLTGARAWAYFNPAPNCRGG